MSQNLDQSEPNANPNQNEPNDWTIMFFFGSDNELSLLNVSQIKALKDAGFQAKTELLLYFDSNQRGVPTRLFNVNKDRRGKSPETHVGDGTNSFVRNFIKDEILPKDLDPYTGECTQKLLEELQKPDTLPADETLECFIGYCQENHPAKHFMLILVGHGMIVANDSFLADDNPRSTISLKQLGDILRGFKNKVKDSFELLGLHSCSMSGIEVACELKDTANYMIASQGFAYVGSWPYRQLLKKIYNVTNKGLTEESLQDLIQRIYEHSLYNATDFAFSGYSHDLTLCSLAQKKLLELTKPLQKLAITLRENLKIKRVEELIQLAHLRSQSFWREEYTDIYDFCSCLKEDCEGDVQALGADNPAASLQKTVAADCKAVMDAIKQKEYPFDGLVVFSDNFGSDYQYAHGLSIYFPWARPVDDPDTKPLDSYPGYAFFRDRELGHAGKDWFEFLQAYWKITERKSSDTDKLDDLVKAKPADSQAGSQAGSQPDSQPDSQAEPQLDPQAVARASSIYGSYNKASGRYNKPSGGYTDSQCTCPTIKNFPTKTHLGRTVKRLSLTDKVRQALERSEKDESIEGQDG